MSILQGALRVVRQTADAITAAAGAVGGAAVSGVVGGIQGTALGVRNGVRSGSHSTPAAALTLAALGAAGLVEWPVLVTVGGTALLLRQLNHRSDAQKLTAAAPVSRTRSPAPAKKSPAPAKKLAAPVKKSTTAAKRSAKKASKAPARKAARSRPTSTSR